MSGEETGAANGFGSSLASLSPSEYKSLSPDGKPCDACGLLLRRPIEAMTPFIFIGKKSERKAQEGEDISVIENSGPIRYQVGQTKKTRAADPALILRAKKFSIR